MKRSDKLLLAFGSPNSHTPHFEPDQSTLWMMWDLFTNNSPWIVYGFIPFLIFVARVLDVSIGTVRIVYLMKGEKALAATLGFVESLIWLLAISHIIQNVTNVAAYVGWSLGFATGNYVGLLIEERLAVGKLILRVITAINATEMISDLKEAGYGVTHIDAQGASGKVKLIFCVIAREKVEPVVAIIKKHNPKGFYTIEDVRLAKEGVFPVPARSYRGFQFFNVFRLIKRK